MAVHLSKESVHATNSLRHILFWGPTLENIPTHVMAASYPVIPNSWVMHPVARSRKYFVFRAPFYIYGAELNYKHLFFLSTALQPIVWPWPLFFFFFLNPVQSR
jgi:hypothetical protein